MKKDIKNIPVADVRPNDWNGNRTADEGLVESVKEHGILQPICVQPKGKGYVCVFGARRLDAAGKAGLKDIPALVLPKGNADRARLLTLVENLQREAQDPLTEGQIYKTLIAAGMSEKEVAKRTGATPRQVRQRLALTKLCPQARALLYEVPYDLPALAMLAECPPTKQMTAIESMPYLLTDPDEMKEWIEGNTALQNAPFDTADKTLDPAAGSCADCPKRSGAQGLLFGYDEKEAGACLDEGCYARKVSANVGRSIAELRKKHPTAECLVTEFAYHYATPEQKALYDGNGAVPMKELRFATTPADKANPEAKTVILVEKGRVSEAVVVPNPREKDGRAAKPKTPEEKAESLKKKRAAWRAEQVKNRLKEMAEQKDGAFSDDVRNAWELGGFVLDMVDLISGRPSDGEPCAQAAAEVFNILFGRILNQLYTPSIFSIDVEELLARTKLALHVIHPCHNAVDEYWDKLVADAERQVPE